MLVFKTFSCILPQMEVVYFVLIVANLFVLILSLILLIRFRRRERKQRAPGLTRYPPISMIVPIKGPMLDLENHLKSLIDQDYLGDLELVVAIEDYKDPDIPIVQNLFASTKAAGKKVQCRLIVGRPRAGFNPKNANVYQAYIETRHDWVYVSDADTRINAHHLREAIDLTGGNEMEYVTSYVIHERPIGFGACLEVMGTNFEITNYFMLESLREHFSTLYGGSYLVNKTLLEKAGGFKGALNRVTDDLYLSNQFRAAGGKAHLARSSVRAVVGSRRLIEFWRRYHRWLLITQTCKPLIFFVGPLAWAERWGLLFGGLFSIPLIWQTSLAVLGFRYTLAFIY